MADQTESQTANGKRAKRLSPGTKRIMLIVVGVLAVLILIWLVHYETRGMWRAPTTPISAPTR